jgi:ankyrin repeat protein
MQLRSGSHLRYTYAVIGFALLVGCGDPPLVKSIKSGDVKTSKDLLAQGKELNAQDRNGSTALHVAIATANRELYLELLERGANPNLCDKKGSSVLHLAAKQDDVFWIEKALEHGGNPNQPNTGNRHFPDSTPLHYAINARKPANAIALIAAGADINHMNADGWRPLKSAMGNGLRPLVIQLLEAGADPRLPDNNGLTIMNCCGWFNDGPEVVFKPIDLIEDEQGKHDYLRIKQLLTDKGYLTPESLKR